MSRKLHPCQTAPATRKQQPWDCNPAFCMIPFGSELLNPFPLTIRELLSLSLLSLGKELPLLRTQRGYRRYEDITPVSSGRMCVHSGGVHMYSFSHIHTYGSTTHNTNSLAGWLAGWLAGGICMTGWPTGWLTDWLTGWLADSLLVTFLYAIELQAEGSFF